MLKSKVSPLTRLSPVEGEMMIILDGFYGVVKSVINELLDKGYKGIATMLGAWILKPLKEIVMAYAFINGEKDYFFKTYSGIIIK